MNRSFVEVEKEYRVAFEQLAVACEAFLGHTQTLRNWLMTVFMRYGTGDMNRVLNGWKILCHVDLGFSRDSELLPKFSAVLAVLQKIDGLSKELAGAQVQEVTVPA